ncbi:hypothetical protein ABID82_004273 [Methylobacterium sp. PvP062]|uniref:Uncharacterized protein n=1 Tax=Methylobacterium radiotolerans TaxID=31998 RepID=A0ABV2NL56_9HYPH|nr:MULTISPECIES: hypothetical protein [unclassified Methylobacterium]KZC01437.1 hypothetical protein AU375_02361 [Methylobacterium radiotolerans]MBP2496035.1 hypothetical protein [Methylobacterium sp. PvP105]MBP2504094.1 hypothetical protein [Methylobacterium sp. PvP109]MCX7333115.1 hypothetical protein [Hyphomicrobiales bacterium]
MAYRLTNWTQLKDQDAEVCHLVEVFDGVEDEEAIATFSRCPLGERLAEAALAMTRVASAAQAAMDGTSRS